MAVAPLVGAWIEIKNTNEKEEKTPSLPSWERGLKFSPSVDLIVSMRVAPLVGAWIEISAKKKSLLSQQVAPLVGV